MFWGLFRKMVDWKLCAWVSGKQRSAVIKAMTKPLTPSQVCKRAKQYNEKISLNNTSDILRSFKAKGLAVCLNEDVKIGRFYQLTAVGKEILDVLMKG
jgi:hypothetical protein